MRPSVIAHGDLEFHNPLTGARVDDVLARCTGARSLLDAGCGPGALHRRSGLPGVGLDSDPDLIAAASAPGAEFRVADLQAEPLPTGFDLVACIGSLHAVAGGLDALAAASERWLLVGDGFWRRRPSPALLDALGGATEDELPTLAGLLARGDARYLSVATDEDWDRYEWTLIANALAWADAHPGDPLEPAVRAYAESARARVALPGARGTLGFALVLYRV